MSRSQAQTVSAIPETPLQIFQRTSTRELQLSRLLIFFSGSIADNVALHVATVKQAR